MTLLYGHHITGGQYQHWLCKLLKVDKH